MNNNWISLDSLENSSTLKVFAGTVIRVYSKLLFSEDGYYDYLLSFISENSEYLQMTCLAKGEEGNIVSILKIEDGTRYTTIREVKRLCGGYEKVYINFEPTIKVN